MLKKFLALVSFILFTYSLLASVRGTGEMIIEWDYNLNVSSSTDIADGVAIDSDNNIIVAGYDRDPGNDQWRIMKFDQNKDLVWNKKFDFNPNYHDRAHDVAVDSENNIIVVGYYRNATSERDWMIMKLDSSGTSIWNYTRDISNGVDRAYGVAVDSDNNITVVGHDQEPGNLQWRVIKLDKDKNLLWDKPFEISTSDDEAFDVAVDSENNIIVVGYYWNATSGRDLMIMKLGPFGNHVWNYTRGISSNDDRARGVAIDSDNNITVVGYYYNSSVSADGWMIMKLNSSGNHVWNYTIDPSLSSDIAYDVAIDSENNIIVVGYYWNATNGEDWMMMKLDSSGNSVWNYTRSISTSDDRALGITNYSNNNIIVVGYDQNTTDSNPHQWRIMEFTLCGNGEVNDMEDCDYQSSLSNPDPDSSCSNYQYCNNVCRCRDLFNVWVEPNQMLFTIARETPVNLYIKNTGEDDETYSIEAKPSNPAVIEVDISSSIVSVDEGTTELVRPLVTVLATTTSGEIVFNITAPGHPGKYRTATLSILEGLPISLFEFNILGLIIIIILAGIVYFIFFYI